MSLKRKVIVYVVQKGKLLVFRHTEFSYEEVGIQVPAGTIQDDESPESAAARELQEETGYAGFKIVAFLGSSTYDMNPEKSEIHERYFFLAEPTEPLPERWKSKESHDQQAPPTNFECFWIPLERGHILQSGQGVLLGKINTALLQKFDSA